MTVQTTFATGSSPWAGLSVAGANPASKEKPLVKYRKPPKEKAEARARSIAALLGAKKVSPKGEQNHMAVLTDEQAKEIIKSLKEYRRLRDEIKNITPAAISKKYKVSSETIRSICKGRSWSHLSEFKQQ